MIVKLLTELHLEFPSLKGGCRGSSESTHVKIPHCWKSYALAQFYYDDFILSCRIYLSLKFEFTTACVYYHNENSAFMVYHVTHFAVPQLNFLIAFISGGFRVSQ